MLVSGTGSRIGTNGDGTSDELERNIIAGNLYQAWPSNRSRHNVLAGNCIGLDVNGIR
jgi:hypothetical protein